MTDNVQRATILVAIVSLLMIAVALDQVHGPASLTAAPSVALVPASEQTAAAVAPVAAISSSWYCAAALAATPGSGAPSGSGSTPPPSGSAPSGHPAATARVAATLLMANSGPMAVQGTITAAGSSAAPVPVTVPGRGQLVVDVTRLARGPEVAVTVALQGGGVAVEQRVSGPRGLATAPCSSRPAQQWFFASGSTAAGDDLLVSLYNPLPTSAIADLSFTTDQGPVVPSDDQGVVVPPQSQLTVDVGVHVQERALVATDVNVRMGRLVVFEVELGSTPARPGMALALGASALGTQWDLPAGAVGPGAAEEIDIFNPSPTTAAVSIGLGLATGSAEPLQVSVAGDAVVAVSANSQHRIPLGVLFSASVVSTNGVPVVAERSILDTAPRTVQGRSYIIGGLPARHWMVAGGASSAATAESLIVQDPGPTPALVSVSLLDASSAGSPAGGLAAGLSEVPVAAGRPLALPLSAHLTPAQLQHPLEVTSSVPVVVEQDLGEPAGRGLSTVPAEPSG